MVILLLLLMLEVNIKSQVIVKFGNEGVLKEILQHFLRLVIWMIFGSRVLHIVTTKNYRQKMAFQRCYTNIIMKIL